MSGNSLSSSSLLHPNISFISSDILLYMFCFSTKPGSFIFISYFITYILLLLPLCIFIIYHGVQQWRQTTSSAATMSHSDSFTYNMVTMDLFLVFGCILCCFGIYSHHLNIFFVGFSFGSFTGFGQTFFHVLTCVERYLAVVHPVTYLSLRKERGIRIRNISIGCVWLLCFVPASLLMAADIYKSIVFCLLILSLTVVSFCSVSVLCVLIRPGPGEQGGRRERVDKSRQRAFYTIMVILGVLVLRFAWNLILGVLVVTGKGADCVIITSGLWFNLPSSLVLPLLFLHRAEKFMCCRKNIQQEDGQT